MNADLYPRDEFNTRVNALRAAHGFAPIEVEPSQLYCIGCGVEVGVGAACGTLTCPVRQGAGPGVGVSEDEPGAVRALLSRLPPGAVARALHAEAQRIEAEALGRVAALPEVVYAEEAAKQRARADALEAENEALRAALKVPLGTPLSEPGKAGFDAYNAYRGGRTHDGKPTPPWEELGDGVRTGWVCAAVSNIGALVPLQAKMAGELTALAAQLEDERDAALKVNANLVRELEQLRAVAPESKLAIERKARDRFVAEVQCLRRWYMRGGGKGSCMGPMPDAHELFELYPDLAPPK